MTAQTSILDREHHEEDIRLGESQDYLTVVIAGQLFGIPVLQVQDVLGEQRVTKIPLAPPEVAGSLNLRGRIVTAIDVRCRLGLNINTDAGTEMSVVVEHENELYSLIIDDVGDVLTLYHCDFEGNPATLDPVWREISLGIYQMEKQLLVVLDVPKLLNTVHS
ncbi:MAG: chemotaxis protein CheW [Rhodospirillales bacterium]|nr:chemotaxis protein CheW [Rhodospirillales bacterium]